MKLKTISVLCIALVLVVASAANAQVKAGSDEDKAFRKIAAEKNQDAQIPMLLEFEKQFPQSKALSEVYAMLVDIYMMKQDNAKIIEFGEKAIKADQQKDVSTLVAVSRAYTLERKNLEVAVSYAQKAVDNVEKMKAQSAPSNYSDAEWKQLIKDNEEAAKGQLSYAKAVKQ